VLLDAAIAPSTSSCAAERAVQAVRLRELAAAPQAAEAPRLRGTSARSALLLDRDDAWSDQSACVALLLDRPGDRAACVAAPRWRRIIAFASPFRALIWAFLVRVVIASAMVVATPLLFQRIIDDGVLADDRRVVVTLALIIAGSRSWRRASRWRSAGTPRDRRRTHLRPPPQVFGHVQRMPIAFSPAPNRRSGQPAQQRRDRRAARVHVHPVRVVSNVISLIMVVGAMAMLSPLITLVALALLPCSCSRPKWPDRQLAASPASRCSSTRLGTSMTERFASVGALLVKLFDARRRRRRLRCPGGPGCETRACASP
jgi:hypothetical protein